MSDLDSKKTILFISENEIAYKLVYKIVEKHFPVEYAKNHIQGFNMLNENIEKYSAVLIDDDLTIQDNFDFLKSLSLNLKFSSLAVIVMLRSNFYDEMLKFFDHGATEVILPPYNEKIIIKRIENSIKIKDSMTFNEIEKMLNGLALNIFLKDREGKYIFSTYNWRNLEFPDNPNWSIRGKTDIEIQRDIKSAIASMESDKELVRTGKGSDNVLEVVFNGEKEYRQLIKRPVFDNEGHVSGIIGVLKDVTELENLKRRLQQGAIIDDPKEND